MVWTSSIASGAFVIFEVMDGKFDLNGVPGEVLVARRLGNGAAGRDSAK